MLQSTSMTIVRVAAISCALAFLVSGCTLSAGSPDAPRNTGQSQGPSHTASASHSPSPSPTLSPDPLETGQIPVPQQTPGQDPSTLVNGFDPLTVVALCDARLKADYPDISGYRPYATGDVFPAHGGPGVGVQRPYGKIPDGRPYGIMVCAVDGTPAAPIITYTGGIDI